MDEGMILLILNIFFAVSLVIGFFIGFAKGLKKAGLRIAFFFVAVLVSAILAPILAKIVLNIHIPYNGSSMSISDVILSIIKQSEQVREILEASPTLETLVQNLPLMVGNIAMFIVLTFVLGFFSWIIYLIVASIAFKGDKKVNKAGNVVRKSKKFRLLGGLIGAAQALAVLFILFFPFTGAIGILNEVSTNAPQQEVSAEYVYAEGEEVAEKTETGMLVDKYLPDIAKTIIGAVNKSVIYKVNGVGGLDGAMINSISAVKVNGTKIFLKDEVVSIANVYNSIGFVLNIDFSDLNNLKTLDYDRLINAVNYAFESNILKVTIPEVTDYAFNKVLENETVASSPDYTQLLTAIKTDMTANDQIVANLKNDIVSGLKTLKILAKSHVLDNVPLNREREITNDDIKAILNIMSANQKRVLNDVVDEMLNSKALDKGLLFVMNKGLDFVDERLQADVSEEEKIDIGRLNLNDSNVIIKKAEIVSLLSSAVNVLNETIDANFEEIKDDVKLVFDLNLNAIINNIGSLMNAVQNMSIFETTHIYNNLLDVLNKSEYSKYVDFDVLKQSNIWTSETSLLAESVGRIKDSTILSYVQKDGDGYKVEQADITNIFTKLAYINNINGRNTTTIRLIVEPLYNSKSLRKLLNFGLDNLGNVINDFGKNLGEEVVLGDVNYDKLYTETEKENFLSLLDNIVLYAKDVDIDELQENALTTLLGSNLSRLGNCLDSVKATSLFADTVEDGVVTKGIYTNLIEALENNDYSEFVNFASFLEDDFSFNTELSGLQSTIDVLLNKIIVDNEQEYNLLSYITEVGNFEEVFKQVSSEDLRAIFTPLMNSKMFSPIGTLVINKINEQIKNIVGEFGEDIDINIDISNLTEEEVEEIIDIVETVTEVIDEITSDDFSVDDFMTGDNADKVAELLDKLQNNANNEGAFTEAYNAFLEYAQNDPTIGAMLQEELQDPSNYKTDDNGNIMFVVDQDGNPVLDEHGNPQPIIDWVSVIAKLKVRLAND